MKVLKTKRMEACLIGSIKGQSIRDVSYYFISGRFSSFTKLSCYFRYYFCAWWKAKLNVYEAWGYNRCTHHSCYAIYAACVVKVEAFKWQRYLIEWEIAYCIYRYFVTENNLTVCSNISSSRENNFNFNLVYLARRIY